MLRIRTEILSQTLMDLQMTANILFLLLLNQKTSQALLQQSQAAEKEKSMFINLN